MFMKSFLTVMAASGTLLAASAAQAVTITGYTDAPSFIIGATGANAPANQVADQVNWAAFDSTINQPSNNGTIPDGQAMTTNLGEKITVTNSSTNAKQFTTYVEGAGTWDGNFVNGTTVLYNANALSTTLSFGTALSGLGVDLQTKLAGTYQFTITAFTGGANGTGGTQLGQALSLSGSSAGSGSTNGTSHEGTVLFAGLTSSSADISYVTITSTNNTLGFAIDTSLIYHTNTSNQTTGNQGQTTPEPGTLALLGAGLAALGAVRRRRNRA
jgi:hypothetical protein